MASLGLDWEPYFSKLKAVVAAAEKRGMVVDVTLARTPCLPTPEAHLRAAETLADALQGWRNVYFDLANQRDQNYPGGGFVSYAELRALRDRVKAADPGRLGTASDDPVGAGRHRDRRKRSGIGSQFAFVQDLAEATANLHRLFPNDHVEHHGCAAVTRVQLPWSERDTALAISRNRPEMSPL